MAASSWLHAANVADRRQPSRNRRRRCLLFSAYTKVSVPSTPAPARPRVESRNIPRFMSATLETIPLSTNWHPLLRAVLHLHCQQNLLTQYCPKFPKQNLCTGCTVAYRKISEIHVAPNHTTSVNRNFTYEPNTTLT